MASDYRPLGILATVSHTWHSTDNSKIRKLAAIPINVVKALFGRYEVDINHESTTSIRTSHSDSWCASAVNKIIQDRNVQNVQNGQNGQIASERKDKPNETVTDEAEIVEAETKIESETEANKSAPFQTEPAATVEDSGNTVAEPAPPQTQSEVHTVVTLQYDPFSREGFQRDLAQVIVRVTHDFNGIIDECASGKDFECIEIEPFVETLREMTMFIWAPLVKQLSHHLGVPESQISAAIHSDGYTTNVIPAGVETQDTYKMLRDVRLNGFHPWMEVSPI